MSAKALALLLAALLALPATAELYRWTDEDGKVHYSDRKPAPDGEETKVEDIGDQLTPVNIDESHKQRQALNRVFAEDKTGARTQRQQNRQQQARERERQAQCRKARRYLRDISGPVAFVDKDGKDLKVSERERREHQAEMEALIRKHCD